ncbi:MAG: hypothetical protein HZA66_17640 [Rhodopseudomonas palustris]|uniref:Uncharacterized protein n=1 Tax=Rhodopseudomonas palustris TaxID=1076 RepID=A0A933S1D1_RHOPL|nr:hypothetical protein [Rhodopseudomonas palustris]
MEEDLRGLAEPSATSPRRTQGSLPILGRRIETSGKSGHRVIVRGVVIEKDDDKKGFVDEDALKILSASLEPSSNKMSSEMAAARRWVPWICAHTGARVNELTSLEPSDFILRDGFHCISIRGDFSKSGKSKASLSFTTPVRSRKASRSTSCPEIVIT